MRIAVLSDTHGHLGNVQRARERLQQLAPVDAILHCGDVGSSAVVDALAAWPTHYVLGNVDGPGQEIAQAVARTGGCFHGRFGDLELAGVRIALVHSDDREVFQEAVRSGFYTLICYGHTHRAEIRREGDTVVLNPGALFRAPQHSFATVDLLSMQVEIHWLSSGVSSPIIRPRTAS